MEKLLKLTVLPGTVHAKNGIPGKKSPEKETLVERTKRNGRVAFSCASHMSLL